MLLTYNSEANSMKSVLDAYNYIPLTIYLGPGMLLSHIDLKHFTKISDMVSRNP